jgi:multiple sugar transport system ATP-binding protein
MNLIEGPEAKKHGAFTIGVRPEHMTVSKTEGAWKGKVGVAEHLGSDTFIHVHETGLIDMMTVRINGDIPVRHGDTVYLSPDLDKLHRFDAQGLRQE